MESDIVTRLREATVPRLEMGWPAPHVVQRKEPLWLEAAEEIERLRAELATANAAIAEARRMISEINDENERLNPYLAAALKERDEARREACLWALPKGVVWNEAMLDRAKAIAAERGWDCFAKEGGGA